MENNNMSKIFFGADIHFSHGNILDFSPQRIEILGLDKVIDREELKLAFAVKRDETGKYTQTKKWARGVIDVAAEAMDELLIEKWNEKVALADDVYIIGDMSFAKLDRTKTLVHRLNGVIHLVEGNHDYDPKRVGRYETVCPYLERVIGGVRIIMSHYQFVEFNGQHRGNWHVHGHQHGKGWKHPGKVLDVSMESTGTLLIDFDQLKKYMGNRPIVPHGDSSENFIP